MSRRRNDSILGRVLGLMIILAIWGYSSAAAFWNSLSPEVRTWFLVLSTVVLASGGALAVLLVIYRKRQREQAWARAIAAWGQSHAPAGTSPVRGLNPQQLETFTASLFRQMGYRAQHTGRIADHGIDVKLVNPQGGLEVVQCKQWNKPVGEPDVRNLAGAMMHVSAQRGFLVAPGGFSASAHAWVRGKPITLLDEKGLSRLVQTAYGSKS